MVTREAKLLEDHRRIPHRTERAPVTGNTIHTIHGRLCAAARDWTRPSRDCAERDLPSEAAADSSSRRARYPSRLCGPRDGSAHRPSSLLTEIDGPAAISGGASMSQTSASPVWGNPVDPYAQDEGLSGI